MNEFLNREQDRKVGEALSVYRSALAPVAAPAAVEGRLLAAVRRRRGRARAKVFAAWAAAAAVILVAVSWMYPRPEAVARVAYVPAPAQPQRITPAADGARVEAPATVTAAVSKRRAAIHRPIRKAAPPIDETPFVAFPGRFREPGEFAQMVRVRLARSALSSLGIPTAVEAPDARVVADVLMGEDGSMQAIRFVQTANR